MIFTTHKTPYFRLSALLLLMLSLTYCRDDDDQIGCPDAGNPDCDNYDPCYGVEAPTADFLMQSPIFGFRDTFKGMNDWLLTPDDSLFLQHVRFTAVHKGHHHQFFIGREVIEEESVQRNHGMRGPYATYASHVITYEADEGGCYEAGTDTLTRNYYFPEHPNDFAVNGKFRVAHIGSTDSFDLGIRLVNRYDGSPSTTISHENSAEAINFHHLDPALDDKHRIPNSDMSNGWGFFNMRNIRGLKGNIRVLTETNEVRIRYGLRNEDPEKGFDDYELRGRILENFNVQDR